MVGEKQTALSRDSSTKPQQWERGRCTHTLPQQSALARRIRDNLNTPVTLVDCGAQMVFFTSKQPSLICFDPT